MASVKAIMYNLSTNRTRSLSNFNVSSYFIKALPYNNYVMLFVVCIVSNIGNKATMVITNLTITLCMTRNNALRSMFKCVKSC